MDGFIQSEGNLTGCEKEIPIGLVMVIFEDLQDHIINNKGLKKVALEIFLGFYRSENPWSAILGLDRTDFT